MGFEKFTIDDYEIGKDGTVFNKKWGRFVKPQPNGMGYLRVGICGKLMFVHRLVAEKYIPNPENKPQVNHIDGNPKNNRVENLEWVTQEENMAHAVRVGLQPTGQNHPMSKLKKEDVDFIKSHPEKTRNELAEMFNISPRTITDIRQGRTWKNC